MISIKKRKEVRSKTRLIDFAPSAPSLKLEATLTDDTVALIRLRVGPGGSNRSFASDIEDSAVFVGIPRLGRGCRSKLCSRKKGIIFQMSTIPELE